MPRVPRVLSGYNSFIILSLRSPNNRGLPLAKLNMCSKFEKKSLSVFPVERTQGYFYGGGRRDGAKTNISPDFRLRI